MKTKLLIETLSALQKGQYEINKSVLEATGASEEQMASYTRMYEAMAKIQGHTNNLVLLLDVLGEKAGDNDNE